MDANPRAGRREWAGLGVLALTALLVSIDVFVLLLALPYLSADLGAGATEQLWIMDVYGFLLSGFLITMGGLGDRIGRRRVLLAGAAGFGVASVVAAYATSPEMLIVARAVLGVAGATLAPSTLSLIGVMFRDARQRSMAIGIWFACFMGGAALGPILGGLLLEHFWWGSAFLIGVPAMALLLVTGPLLLPEFRDRGAGRIDLPSVALSLGAILPLVYGLKELARGGWQPVPVAALAIGLLVGTLFARRQRHLDDPLLDLRLFRNGEFAAVLAGMMAVTMLLGSIMMFLTQHLQLVQGLSPLKAAVWMLPALLANLLGFQLSPLLARRVRPAVLIACGLAVSIAGLLILTQVGTAKEPLILITGWAMTGLGGSPLVTLGTNLIIGSVPEGRAGAAAAINETSGEFGYALGIAIMGSIGAAVYRAGIHVPAGAPDAVRENLAGAVSAAGNLPGPVRDALLDTSRTAFTSGMHVVALVSAVIMTGMAVLLAVTLRHVPLIGAAKTAAPELETVADQV